MFATQCNLLKLARHDRHLHARAAVFYVTGQCNLNCAYCEDFGTRWPNLFCAEDWVRDPLPAFFLEHACATGIKAANEVLAARGLELWPLVDYLTPKPFVGWIEKAMVRGRKKIRARKKNTGKRG